jgi:phage gpG-like protein
MAAIIRVQTDYLGSKAIEHIKKIERAATHLKPVLKKSKRDLEEEYVNHFLSNGGGTWKPLDPEYGTWKASRFPGAPTLIRTGELFQSVSKLETDKLENMSATFSVDSEVASFHQFGTWSMPKRELIFEPPMFVKKLAEDIADHIKGKI